MRTDFGMTQTFATGLLAASLVVILHTDLARGQQAAQPAAPADAVAAAQTPTPSPQLAPNSKKRHTTSPTYSPRPRPRFLPRLSRISLRRARSSASTSTAIP